MLLNQASAATATSLLDALSAAATANATSGSGKWLDVRSYDGELLVTQQLGAVTGSIAGKLQSATDANGTGAADITGYTFSVNTANSTSTIAVDPEKGPRRLSRLCRHDRHRAFAGEHRRLRQEEDRLKQARSTARRLNAPGTHSRRRPMFTENLAAFFNTSSGFAIAATLQGGSAGGVAVIFDEAYLEQLGIAGTRPQALVQATAVLQTDVDKTLTIGATTYTIKGRELVDDGAIAVLTLKL